MKKNWYSITNVAPDTAEISIYDEIGFWGITAKDFIGELKAVGDRRIVLRINSPGGDVFDGLAIYNRLRDHAPGVEVKIDGLAASVASIIAMAGTKITMAENALLMIHNPTGICAGESADMRELAALLDKVKSSLITAYERRLQDVSATTQPCDIAALMDAETWFTAAEAQAAGFVDDITPALKMAARFDTSKFRNTPAISNHMNPLRTSILALLSLTDPATAPLTDEQIAAALTTAITARATAETALAETRENLRLAETKVSASAGQFTGLLADVKASLALTDEQVTNLVSDKAILPAAVAKVANAKAVEIAAAQGVPPIPTKPAEAGADDIKEVFATAAAEPDPRKRGALFAAASARLAAKAKTHGNN